MTRIHCARVVLSLALLALVPGCEPASMEVDAGRDARTPLDTSVDAPFDAGPADAASDDVGDDAMSADVLIDAGRSRIDEVVALLSATPPDAGAIDAIVHDVAWHEGWPLHEGSRWLFATTFADAPAALTLTGGFDGWSTTAHPALRSATGQHFWIVVDDVEFEVAAEGALYKWIAAGDEYRAPPEATAYGFDDFGRFGYVRPDPSVAHFEQFPDHVGAHLEAPRTLRAYLPAGFVAGSAEATAMRTLLLHDGQNVFGPEGPFGGWHVDSTLGLAPFTDVVALAIDNAPDRMDAYTHVADVIGGGSIGGRADDYLALVEDEALPFFRARYGVIARGDSLAIMGSSLGGLVTVYAAATHASLFGCGAALSPTLGWGSFASGASDSLITSWPTAVGHGATSLYLDSGGGGTCLDDDDDGVQDDGSDSDNYCVTAQLRDVLVGQGYAFDVDLSHWWEPAAAHNEAAWAARTERALRACSALGWRAP